MDPANPGTDPAQPQVPTEPATPQQPQASQAPSEPTPAPQQPDVADLQRQLAELTRQRETAEQSARYFQSQFDKVRSAVSPNQPAQDPLAPYIKQYTDAGVDEAQARLLVQNQYAMVQPLIQQNQQLSAALQGSSQVQDVMRQSWTKVPQAFSDPNIAQQVEAELRQTAMQGRPIDVDYAIDLAAILTQRNAWLKPNGAPPPAAAAPNFTSQFGPASAFNGMPQRAQAQAAQLTPEQQAASDAVRQYWGLPTKTSQQAS